MTTTTQNSQASDIAAEVLRQLGGRQAAVMIGMTNRAYGTDEKGNAYVSFRFKGSRNVNYCKITLNAMDLYDMEIGKIHGMKYKVIESHDGIYSDMMKDLFEQATKLYLSL